MADGSANLMQAVYYKGGYVLLYPRVTAGVDLLEKDVPPNPYASSVSQEFPLGTRCISAEHEWAYCYNGAAALIPGYCVQSPASAGAAHDMDMVTAAADVGDYTVTITPGASTSMTANQYKEGILFTNDLAGEGQSMRIKSHPAITHSTTGILTLYDPVTLALTSATLTGVRKNPYNGVVITPHTTLTGYTVAVVNIPVPINYYFWGIVKGECAIHTIGTVVIGQGVTDDTTTGSVNGAVGPPSAFTERIIGVCVNASVTTDKSLINVNLS